MNVTTAVSLLVTVGLAATGYLVTYRSNLRLARRKDRLDRVNRQLAELYGPLFALVHASGTAFAKFSATYWPGRRAFFQPGVELSRGDLELWRRWVTHAFMPLNRRMVDVVIAHSDLLREEEIPRCLLDLCAHVAGYEPVVAHWSDPGFDSVAAEDHTAPLNFPAAALTEYVDEAITALRREQTELLAVVQADGTGRWS
jgi:hypothetical protein